MPENFEQQFDPWAKVETPTQESEPQTIETPIGKEEFVPEEVLVKIKEAPKEERRERVTDFKKRLALQKESLAKMQETMIARIKESPDMPIEELKAIAQDFSQKNDINTEQLNRTNEVLDRYVARHKLIKETREKYPDDRELFKALYGKYPDGKINVVVNPLTISIRCYNLHDYAFIRYEGWQNNNFHPTEEQLSRVMPSGGGTDIPCLIPELESLIIVENPQAVDGKEELLETIHSHEEQHIMNRLFGKEKSIEKIYTTSEEMREKLSKTKTEDKAMNLFTKGFRFERRKKERETKEELLAYFKSGDNLESVARMLKGNNSGQYNYFEKYLKPDFVNHLVVNLYGEKYRTPIEKGLKQVFETEYHQLIDRAINAFKYLLRDGKYSREQAIAILMQEPLNRWAKVTERILKAKDSIRNRQEKQKLTELEKSQVEAMAENKARDAEKIPTSKPQKEDPVYKPDKELEEDLSGF